MARTRKIYVVVLVSPLPTVVDMMVGPDELRPVHAGEHAGVTEIS